MRRPVPFHPFVLAVYPVIFLYSQNAAEVRIQNTFVSLILSFVFALVAFLLLVWWLKDARKGALLVSLFLATFFSYGHIVHLMASTMGDVLVGDMIIGPNKILAPLWTLFFVVGCFLVLRTRKDLSKPTSLLNIIAVILTAPSLVATGAQSWRLNETSALKDGVGETEGNGSRGNSFNGTSPPPNIYYIILDEYAGADVLEQIHQMDNSRFLYYLKDKGFYVASKSRSNYCVSNFSIPSSLNFTYLNHHTQRLDKDSQDLRPVLETVPANRFTRILRRHGYRVASFSSAMAWTEWGNAEYYYAPPFTLNEFETQLLKTTMAPLVHKLFGVGWDPVKLLRTRILYVFDTLPKTVELPPPVFVFAHLMCPHPPALFGPDGPRTTLDEMEWVEDVILWGGRQIGFVVMDSNEFFALSPKARKRCSSGYTGQVEFVNQRLKEVIDQILSRSKTPPIIIIQGDHGSRMLANWEDANRSHVQEHFPILNAYYFPDRNYTNLYPEISPVNTFRVILNQYFGTRYPLLEDRCYFSTHSRPYDFVDVTDRVRNDSLVPSGTMPTSE